MAETKESLNENYEKTIDKLKTENEELKKRVYNLEKENSLLKGRITKIEEKPFKQEKITPIEEIPSYAPVTSVETEKVESISLSEVSIDSNSLEVNESVSKAEVEIPFDLHSPIPTLGGANKPIIEGYSRRQCPHCDNDRKMAIQEKTDKTNIIMQYPRIYGKKYVCGLCGTNWIVKNE